MHTQPTYLWLQCPENVLKKGQCPINGVCKTRCINVKEWNCILTLHKIVYLHKTKLNIYQRPKFNSCDYEVAGRKCKQRNSRY